jgi:hypothetical protein
MEEVLKFISRFPDANWLNGNCYYFAVILQSRFPGGSIYYDTTRGHFLFKYHNVFYDWSGAVSEDRIGHIVEWATFDLYDHLQYQNILEHCIK